MNDYEIELFVAATEQLNTSEARTMVRVVRHLQVSIKTARKAALEEAAKCAEDAGDLWWRAYKMIGSGDCADNHMQGKADGAGEIAAAIRKLGET
jgi:hypothetical protein